MPWTAKQLRLFGAAAHNPDIARKVGIPQDKAREMQMESTHKQRSAASKVARAMHGK